MILKPIRQYHPNASSEDNPGALGSEMSSNRGMSDAKDSTSGDGAEGESGVPIPKDDSDLIGTDHDTTGLDEKKI